MKEGWNVILRHDEALYGTRVYILKQNADGSREIVRPVDLTVTKTHNPYEFLPEPTLQFTGADSIQFLQGLADGLAELGFKPSEMKASGNELTAIKYHLEDMRKLVFEVNGKDA